MRTTLDEPKSSLTIPVQESEEEEEQKGVEEVRQQDVNGSLH